MIRVRQIKVPLEDPIDLGIINGISKKLKISKDSSFSYRIVKKSIDARDKSHIFYVFEVDVEVSNEEVVLKKIHSDDVLRVDEEPYQFEILGEEEIQNSIVVVGSGPAGLFCSYVLAENGYSPILFERGEKMEDRIESVEEFFRTNHLNPESNIQFGEGGAGTFSDGKLNTLVKDKKGRGRKVFDIFVENGAPEEILYEAKPHIGTDLLRNVIVSIRNKILSMGGKIYYSSKVTNLLIHHDKIVGVEVNSSYNVSCDAVVLAIGHSARDTFVMLEEKGVSMKPKNFAVGVRIEHPQEMISKSQYGQAYLKLPPASYKLTYQSSNGRGVYSFCMCPGGFVVNASSEKGRVAVNGMSNYSRNERNANSAIVVTVSPKDFGEGLFAGMEFQRKLEEKAYELGCGVIPIQLYKDFVLNQKSTHLGEVIPNTKGEYHFANLCELFPEYILSALQEAIPYFGTKIQGFDREDAVLLGVESRTSSPVVIERGEECISNIDGLYPCGEGAGYAGGITTAAMDGIKVAEMIAKKYKQRRFLNKENML